MKLLPLYLFIAVPLASATTSTPIYARPGCKDMCGNVRIPYPFGIGTWCYINKWYAVDCNSSTPYLSAINNLELLSVNLENQIATVNVSVISDCRDPIRNSSVELGESPFLFSRDDNKFTVEGCGNAVILDQGENLVTGCSTICQNQTTNRRDDCYGVNCCQTTIPYYLKTYTIDTTSLQRLDSGGTGVCGSAFLVDRDLYSAGRFSGRSAIVDNFFVPVSLRWTLRRVDIDQRACASMVREFLYMSNATASITSYKCICNPSEDGSPYLLDGCQLDSACASCDGECFINEMGGVTCDPSPPRGESSTIGVILGICISIGVLLLVAIIFALYKLFKKAKDKRRKARFFKRNGGLLLKQQESTDEGLVDKTTLFTAKELEKATDHFNENRILGRGGQGTVYKGMLTDGRIVAVKKSKIVDESQVEQFINEVVILSQVNHRNVVKLLGCCLETEVPLLVSEFVSNGTLYQHIHNETEEFPLNLNTRLRIATEIAGALTYLHSATSIPIYHRDIKSTNILMDDRFRAKVSDFGTSRFVSIDKTHLTTLVKGTFGYLDPEYFQSSQFTEKSDVYSFGVVLVELLTGERPILVTGSNEHRSLATHFMMAMEEGEGMAVFDRRIVEEGGRGEIMAVAELAVRCLNLNGRSRPTMKEVVGELERIRSGYVAYGNGFGNSKYNNGGIGEEMIMLSYDDDTTSTSMS